MLEGMRAASQNWIGRSVMAIVMGFIILSFAVWGIGDIFRGFGANDLAKVGSIDISVDAYRNAYQNEMRRLGITADAARRSGVETQVLARLISEAALDQKAKNLNLAISDQDIAKSIVNDEAFKGITGQFDRTRFEGILRNAGFTERSFVANQRGVYLRREITDAITAKLDVPQAMLDAIHRFQTETRSVDYIVLPTAAAGDIPTPSEADLKQFYEQRKAAFTTIETRKLVLLTVTPESLAKTEDVSDADAQKRYDELKDQRFSSPEKRSIEQVPFPDAGAAAAARTKLDGGQTFDALLEERKLTPKDVDLGTVTRDQMVDKAVADAAFALKEGEVSQPVTARFGTVLLRVPHIEPAGTKPFADVEADLKREIATSRAKRRIDQLHDKIEDDRAAGKSLTEAAKNAGLDVRTIDAVDARGRDKSGQPVSGLADQAALLKAAFASEMGADNDTISTRDGGYSWFEVAGVDPARQQSFDEVKEPVEAAWRKTETRNKLVDLAAGFVKKIAGGATLAAIAAQEGNLEVRHAGDVKRSGATGLPDNAIVQIFNGPVGAAGAADGPDNGRILFQVLDAVVPPIDTGEPQLQALSTQVKASLNEDVMAQYLTKIGADLGIKVNAQGVQAAIGSDSNY